MVEAPSEVLESIMALVPGNRKEVRITLGSCRLVSKRFLAAANNFYPRYVTLILYWDMDTTADSNSHLGRLNELLASPFSTIGHLLQSVMLKQYSWNGAERDNVESLLSYIDGLPNVKKLAVGGVSWTDTSAKLWSPRIRNLKTTVTSLKWSNMFSSAAGMIDATAAVASSKLDRFEIDGVDLSDRYTIPVTGGEHGSQILSQATYFNFYDATSHVIPAIFESVICMGGRFKDVDLWFEDCEMYEEDWRSLERLLKQCRSRLERLTINFTEERPLPLPASFLANRSIPTFTLVLSLFNELALSSEVVSVISSVGSLALEEIYIDITMWSEEGQVKVVGFDSFEKLLVEKFGVSNLPNTFLVIRSSEEYENLTVQMGEQMPEMLRRDKLEIKILID